MQPALLLQVFWSTTGQVFRDYLREQRLNFRFIPQHNQYLECKVAPGSSNQEGCVPDLSRRGFSVETLDALEGVLHRASQAALSLVRSIKCLIEKLCAVHTHGGCYNAMCCRQGKVNRPKPYLMGASQLHRTKGIVLVQSKTVAHDSIMKVHIRTCP